MLRRPCLVVLALSGALSAQDVRENSTPVAHARLFGATPAAITNQINAGYRLVDIEYRGGGLYEAAFVQSTGSYATGWWWYYGQTAAQVTANLTANSARLIDIEPHDDGAGNLRFACIMVDNTGANAKTWWWYYGTTPANLATQSNNNNARIVDLDNYTVGATNSYAAVMIRNTGADARTWWWYVDVTAAQVGAAINTNQARLWDLEKRPNGNWDCVMVRDPAPVAWYWWYGVASPADVTTLIDQYGVRAIDVESYLEAGVRRYAVVTINNSNATTTAIGNAMRATTTGTVGCWLQQINGGNLVSLNADTPFEPASTMKTLHHVHAMRRVNLGLVALTTMLNVFTGYSGSCPLDTGAVQQQLQTVLQLMMENSDNARTQAVTAYFGQANINATAAALGMGSTSLNHRIGCAAAAIANPNRITLRDLNSLHAQVVNGWLGNFRDTFYQLMLDSVNDLSVAAVINAEGAAIGLPAWTIASFRNFTRLAHKGGNYALSNGGPLYYHRAEFGWLSLPWITNDVITPREYGFGAFVNNASNDTNAANAIYVVGIPELLRPTIRAALQSWTNSLAGVQPFGAGCSGCVQLVNGLPLIGDNLIYSQVGGHGNSLAVLGIGFSSTAWAGHGLPASLVPFGSEPGCWALNDIVNSLVTVANAAGSASFDITLPNDTALVGAEYLTQCYSFGPALFRTSNSQRSIIGL